MKILILGATSAIAQETAKCFAADGADLVLVGRNAERLTQIGDDLKVRGAHQVTSIVADLVGLYGGTFRMATAPEGGLRSEIVLPAA